MKTNFESKPMTWDELANAYDASHSSAGRPARTLPMETVFSWAEKQTDRFCLHPVDDTLHRIVAEK